MRAPRTTGVLLILGNTLILLMFYGFATLTAGGLDEDSPEWWPTVLGALFEQPPTFIVIGGLLAGIGLCLYRPGMRMTVGRLMVLSGIVAVLLGFFLRAAVRERTRMVGVTTDPDGTKHVVTGYRNWFGFGRTVETIEP